MKSGLRIDEYPFQIRPLSEEEGGGYLIEFLDVPGVISDGATPEEAIRRGRDALKAALLTLREFGDPVPEPGSHLWASGQWRQRVPKSLHARLVRRARQEGVSLNALVTALIAEGLGVRRAAGRFGAPRASRPPKPSATSRKR
jgi:antitoxin HicB